MQVTSCKSSATYFSLSVIYLLCQEHSPFFSLWIPRANRAPGPWCLEPTAPPGLLPCQRKGFWRKPWRGRHGVRRDGSQTSSDDSICLCFSLGFAFASISFDSTVCWNVVQLELWFISLPGSLCSLSSPESLALFLLLCVLYWAIPSTAKIATTSDLMMTN